MINMRMTLVGVAGCLAIAATSAFADTARARLLATDDGRQVGDVVLTANAKSLSISARLTGARPGQHGFHIHELGDCDNGGKAAGGHFNPRKTAHGLFTRDGKRKAHGGDLGNITIGPDGNGTLQAEVKGLTLTTGRMSVAGRAFIVHAKPDDYGQPTGNAGPRVACGPIVLTAPEAAPSP